MRNTTVALYSRLPAQPDLWAVGVGFNTPIADLGAADAPPVDAADQALAAAGLTRSSAWRAHPTRGVDGWLVADALDALDHRPDAGDPVHKPTGPAAAPAIPASPALTELLEQADILLRCRPGGHDVVRLDPDLPGDEYRTDLICGPDPDSPTAVIWYLATSTDAAISQARAWLAALDGPDDRFAEIYTRNGDRGEYLTDVHLGA
jgi:hypothetical protein